MPRKDRGLRYQTATDLKTELLRPKRNLDPDWVRRDPDLVLLHGEPELEKHYPESIMPGDPEPGRR